MPTARTDTQPQPETQDTAAAAQVDPYKDDLEYLEAEMEWIDVRCRRLYLARGLRAVDGPPEDCGYQPIKATPEVIRARHAELVEQERHIRSEIDARLAATWAACRSLGLDQVQEAHHLDDFERYVLLLAAAPVLKPDLEDVLSGACRANTLTVGSIYALLEMGLREKIEHHGYFGEDRVLVGAGFIELANCSPDPCPEELAETAVRLTGKGFRLMLGQVEVEDTEPAPGVEQEPEEQQPGRQRPRCQGRDDHQVEGAALTIPELRLSDVILPDALMFQVEEMVAAAGGRATALQRWGVTQTLSYGTGIVALFHGGPGTGKTHCAYAVAGQLGRPLMEAHAPDLISKWVGQSARNFADLFERAQAEGAVLLLDEADSFVGQRGGVPGSGHDDDLTNALLKLVENHQGLIIMATNMRGALDAALARRVTYHLEFPQPDEVARAAIWRSLIPPTVPGVEAIDFNSLGTDFNLSGGLIKNAVLKACFRAARAGQPITQSLLAAAAQEEVIAQAGATESSRVRVVGFGRR